MIAREANLLQLESEHRARLARLRQDASRAPGLREVIRFYGTIATAAFASVVPVPLPRDFARRADSELTHLAGVLGGVDLDPFTRLPFLCFSAPPPGQMSLESERTALSVFGRFVSVRNAFEHSVQIEQFKGALFSPYGRGFLKSRWEKALKSSRDAERFIRKSRPGNVQDLALHGLVAYFELLPLLADMILEGAGALPIVQSALWHYHADVLADDGAVEFLLACCNEVESEEVESEDEREQGLAVRLIAAKGSSDNN